MEITILQWNIWYQEDIRNVTTFLRQHPADMICIQELSINLPEQSVPDTPKYIAETLGYNYYYKDLPLNSTDGKVIAWADGVFSKFPITNKRFVWINKPKGKGGYDDEYRAYVEITVEIGGKELTVATTHMSYTDRFHETANKRQEANKLAGIIKDRRRNYIFAGDLNATPDSYTIEQISKHLEHTGPDYEQKTWTTKPFSYRGFKATTLGWRLDYIFVTKDIEVLSAKILETDYSDHLPIFAKLKLS